MQEKTEFDYETVERNLDGVTPPAEKTDALIKAWRQVGEFLLPYRNERFYSKGALQRLFILRWLTDSEIKAKFSEQALAEKIGVKPSALCRDVQTFLRWLGFNRNIKALAA